MDIEKVEVYEDAAGQFRYRDLDADGGNQGESGDAYGSEEAAKQAAESHAEKFDGKVKVVVNVGAESRAAEAGAGEPTPAPEAESEEG